VWLAAAAVFAVVCYSPVLLFEYGFSEDYRLLAALRRGGGLSRLMVAEGRPLFAVWARVVFGVADTIPMLAAVRFMNIAFAATIAVAMAAVWRRAGMAAPMSAAAGAAMVTLPPFQLFAATAAMGAVLPAAALAIGAALLVDREADAAGRPGPGRLAVASLLAFAALATYQPAGLFFWVAAAVLLIAPNPAAPAFRRRLALFAVTGGAAMLGAFAIFLAGRSAFPAELIEIGAPRGTLVFDPAGKALWFLTLPLPHALNLWRLWPSLPLAMAAFIALVAGMALHFRGTAGAWWRALLAFSLVPLCYLPNLVVSEDRSSFRSLPALAAIVFAYYVIVVFGQFTGRRRWIARTLLAAGLVAGGITAGRNVVAYIAAPQARELALVRERVAALPADVRLVGVVPSDYRDSLAPMVMYDEFGYPSTALPWSVYTITWLALQERMAGDTAAFHVTDARDAAVVPDVVIDWGEVLRAAR
jgi:hypothetical protein